MICPKCGAKHTELKTIKLYSDVTNEHGRRELDFICEHDDWIEWKDGKYHCKKCGNIFSYQEGVLQKTPNFFAVNLV